MAAEAELTKEAREAMALANAMEVGSIMLTKRSRSNREMVPNSELKPVTPGGSYREKLENSK